MKKLLIKGICSTMVLAMVVGMFSSVAVAAVIPDEITELPASAQPLVDLMTSVHGKLSDSEKADIRAARTLAEALDPNDPIDLAHIEPIWTQVSGALGNDITVQYQLFDLMVDMMTAPYQADGGNMLDIYNHNRQVIHTLLVTAGVSGGVDNAAFTDITAYASALEGEVNVTTLLATLISGSGLAQALEDVANEAIHSMMQDQTYLISQIYEHYGITGAQVIAVKNNILGAVDPDNAALKALGLGYIRTQAALAVNSTTSNSLTPQLVIRGVNIPNLLIDWSENDSNVSHDGTSFVFSSTGSKTVSVTATEKYTGEHLVLFQGDITFNYNPSTSNPDPDPVVLPTLPGQASEVAKEVLKDLADKLATLPPAEKKAEVKKAEKAVEKAIKEAGKATVPVVVTGGVSKPTIDTAALVNKAKEAKALADTLNKDLEASGGKKAEVEFTMDLGTVETDDVEIPLGKDFMDDMSDEGVDTVAVAVNGVEITVDSNEFEEDTTLSIQKKSKEESGDNSGKPVASDYYNFEFTSGGNDIIEFKKPVTLKLPIADTSDYDTDLLTLAKIINGKLEFYGGKYNSEGKYFEGKRNSFSTYAIVENKVEFNDTASVKSWAGRSIEVAAAKGIIAGRGEGVYDPSANVTRAEFAKMLVSTFSLFDNNAKEYFQDVKDTDWYKPYVAAAVSKGIIAGRTTDSFDPNAPITRQEMAVMVARTLKLTLNEVDVDDSDAALTGFTDAGDIGSVYKTSAALVVDQGIINGYAGKFDPKGITTRAQAAVVIKSLIDLQ